MKVQRWLMVGGAALILAGCTSSAPPAPSADQSPTESPQTTAVASPESAATETASPTEVASADVIKAGEFASGEHPTQGTAQLVRQENGVVLVFDSSFQTDNGPDLVVALHQSADVLGSTNPPAYPLNEGEYVVLEPLQTTSGAQEYAVPSDINPDDYQSAVVWCREFNATFGAATLQ